MDKLPPAPFSGQVIETVAITLSTILELTLLSLATHAIK